MYLLIQAPVDASSPDFSCDKDDEVAKILFDFWQSERHLELPRFTRIPDPIKLGQDTVETGAFICTPSHEAFCTVQMCVVSYSIDWDGVIPIMCSNAILLPRFHMREERLKNDPDLALFSKSQGLVDFWPNTGLAEKIYFRFVQNCDRKEEMVEALVYAYRSAFINARFHRIPDPFPSDTASFSIK